MNSAWLEFAPVNGASGLTADAVIGRPLASFIAGDETRHLYDLLFHSVRDQGRELRIPFRCDSPDLRRFMQLCITPALDGAVQCVGRLLRTERRAAVPLLDPVAPRTGETVKLCSFCKKLELGDGRWAEIEEGLEQLGLFEASELPSLSHEACATCVETVQGASGRRAG